MTETELKKLIAQSETLTVEFKRARGGVPADFWPSYSAFANTEGGVIVLGVRETNGKREIEGLSDPEKICKDLWNAANNAEKVSSNVLFNSSVQTVEVDGKHLVVVDVPRAERTERPVFVGADVFKGAYRRNGEGDYHCSREVVEGVIRDKCAETADHCILEELALSDLDAGTIRRYRIYFDQLRPGHVWSSLTDEAFLMRIGAAARTRDGGCIPIWRGSSALAISTRSRMSCRTTSSITANIWPRTSVGRIVSVRVIRLGAETSSISSSSSASPSRRA